MAKESLFVKNIWKWLVLAIVAVGSYFLAYPPKEKVRLGLDLNGGTRFTLEVDQDKLKAKLIEENPALAGDSKALNEKIKEQLKGSEDRIIEIIRRRIDAMGTNEPLIQSVKRNAGENGVDSPRFIVELPGADPETAEIARQRLSGMAYLEFRFTSSKENELLAKLPSEKAPEGYVSLGGGYVRASNYQDVSSSGNYLDKVASFGVPPIDRRNTKFILQRNGEIEYDGRKVTKYQGRFVEKGKPRLTGAQLKSAVVGTKLNEYVIDFELKSEGAVAFAKLTRNNVGRYLAIILDGELVSSPVIKTAIEGGKGEINGDFTLEEATTLANDLKAGALPAPLKVAASTTVAPTVGEDAINSGIYAASIGFLLVALFMVFYYWYAGFVANIALLLDVFLLPASLFLVANILGLFVDSADSAGNAIQLPVLTMPGIAGLVLTLGMAVDANVLIYERIREEFARGAMAGKAIAAGYGKAFTAIIDSNITTILTGIILYSVGTGPVRGFAIMLTGGVVISMFTAIVVTRLLFDHTVDVNRTKPFKMLQFFKNPKFDFMRIGNKMLVISFAIIIATLSLFTYRLIKNPTSVLAVDLTGGTSIVYEVKSGKVDVGAVRKAIEPFDNAALIQTGDNGSSLLIKTGISKDDTVSKITKLLEPLETNGFDLVQKNYEMVGPSVGRDLRESGSKAVIFSLIAILVYIGFRFRFGFGLGGIVALAHDALISLGLFSLCGRQVSLIVITALLTIIGYSINDTVVVFDRIREILKRDSKMPLKEVCNVAINSCLGRTFITSLTTFFTVAVLFIFVDGSIYDFALTMLFGIIAGTFSSVFIATPVMAWWYRNKRPSFNDEEPKATQEYK